MSLKEKVYKKRDGVLHKKLGAEILIIPSSSGKKTSRLLYLRDHVSMKIWAALNGRNTLQQIIRKIARLFDKKPEQIQKDVAEFIKELHENKLIEENRVSRKKDRV